MELQADTTLISPAIGGTRRGWPPPPPPPAIARSQASSTSWGAWAAATVASIWVAVALISVFAPDMTSGSEHQRMPVAAFSTWLWGSGATIASLATLARLRGDVDRRASWVALCGATIVIWTAAALVGIFAPTFVTGSDPTTIPVGALISPIAAMLATGVAGAGVLAVSGLSRTRHDG